MRSNHTRRVFRIASIAMIGLLSTGSALAAVYSSDNLGAAREPTLAGLLMLILLPGLTLGAIVLDRRYRRGW